ncbi:MAG: hypothetical protein K1X53_08035 [Candidatus Sumerlaeaceae bacterium]|nr:hypothetical protein [Candidatus Sumerlaeaceae bacterium]
MSITKYNSAMKTAISIPDDVFQSAEEFSRSHKVSRSALYTAAVKSYLARHRLENVTSQLNGIYGREDSKLSEDVYSAQIASFELDEW